ncbi:MAG: chromosome segregation protein SMC [Planctomycetota bacterium]
MLRLSSLTLHGFKSFADRTEFAFDAPITGVVGPNGCGKSNIVDAIKWVLGTRSAKALRGKEMIDVIFAGSAGRKPAGMASVTLAFDNPELTESELAERRARLAGAQPDPLAEEDTADDDTTVLESKDTSTRALPIDSDRVEVERRLYRDGTSQYLINGKKARLRDIRDLFMDSGIGADAYSIIEQGKVDAMLLSNPVDRRGFLEEAAGIARFKARRVESQRKLDRAVQNLALAREQLESTDRRLRLVRGQATKARKFKELDVEYRALRAAVAFDHYHELRERLNGLTSRLHQLDDDRGGAISALRELEDAKQDAESERHALAEERRFLEQHRAACAHRQAQAEQRRALTERSLAESRAQLTEDEEALEALASQIETFRARSQEAAEHAVSLRARLTDAETGLEHAATERELAQNDLASARLELSEQRAAANELERDRSRLAARQEAGEARLAQARESMRALELDIEETGRELQSLGTQHEKTGASLTLRKAEVGRLTQEIDAATRSARSLSTDQQERADRINDLSRDRTRLDARRSTLEELEASRAGLTDAAKSLLDRRDELRSSGEAFGSRAYDGLCASIIGTLAELIRVDGDHARAVEAALGRDLESLVFDGTVESLERESLDELPGRVLLLPAETTNGMTGIAPGVLGRLGHGADGVTQPAPGGVVSLARLLEVDPRVRRAVQRLLGDTWLVQDLDHARRFVGRGVRLVTPDGLLIEPDGRVIAGPMTSESGVNGGLLSRRVEMEDLNQQIAALDGRLDEESRTLGQIDERARSLDSNLHDLRIKLSEAQRSLVHDEAASEREDAERARLERALAGSRERCDEAREQISRLASESADSNERLESLSRLASEVEERVRTIESSVEALQQKSDAAGERLAASRVEAGQVQEKLSSAEREQRHAESAREEAEGRRERIRERIDQRRGSFDELSAVIREADAEIASARAEEAEAADTLTALSERIAEGEARARSLGDRLGAQRERCNAIDRDWNSLEMGKRELEVRREHLEDRTLEELSIDLCNEYLDFVAAIVGASDVEPLDRPAAEEAATELGKQIKALGNVNLDAIEEEDRLADRNEELAAQVEDIDAARQSLETLIERLSDVSRERFRVAFERISENFAGRGGMFRRLFGGGKAEMRLVPDPETGEIDWLESGVEIVARPPGKEPRAISQLSGGEKAMTAVAILMSIFESKPSPFCILDEVDAPLDDANVERFNSIVRRFLDRAHFIVVTHNKRTMRFSDQLYGVTMQERGVSTRVNVRFDDVGADGRISDRALADAPTEHAVSG